MHMMILQTRYQQATTCINDLIAGLRLEPANRLDRRVDKTDVPEGRVAISGQQFGIANKACLVSHALSETTRERRDAVIFRFRCRVALMCDG